MAIYRLSASVVKRSAGRTVTAAAAYRAGVCITDERTGLTFPYDRRRGVAHAEVMSPASAPAWMRDRARLWNGVEAAEKRKDAQLARDIEMALPHELPAAEHLDLVRGFVRQAFVGDGMVADIAIHEPSRRDADHRNHHAHILLTMRAIEGEGFGAKVRAWNDTARLEGWRALWADHVNRALERAGETARVDHRSLEAQGIDRLPQPKLGPAVLAMEARGHVTDRGDERREVEAINAALAGIEEPASVSAPVLDAFTAPVQKLIWHDDPPAAPAPIIGAIGKLFREAVHAVTRRIRNTAPPKRRGETVGEFRKLAHNLSRLYHDMRKDFRERATITNRFITISAEAYATATAYLSDTFDQLNRLNDDDEHSEELTEDLNANSQHIFPRL